MKNKDIWPVEQEILWIIQQQKGPLLWGTQLIYINIYVKNMKFWSYSDTRQEVRGLPKV